MPRHARTKDDASAGSALSRNDAEFQRLLETLPAGAYTCDSEGLITYFNRPALELWGRAPRLNDRIDRYCGSLKLFTPDGTALAHDHSWMALALRTDKAYNAHEIVIERPDGGRRTVLAHANPIHDESGKVVGAVNVLVDITMRKQTEDMLKRFLATAAHELRNPLAPIRNAVQILSLERTLPPQAQRALGTIDRQVRQMSRLISDLVDVARITSNRLEVRKERVDLAMVLRLAVETSSAPLQAGGQDFVFTPPDEPIFLDADPTRLAQAISNLLENAAKYTARDGRIWLIGERRAGDVIVTVRDTGIGIPSEMLGGIFETLTSEQSPARSAGGLGLGLTLVKRLVEMHGGTVAAQSNGAGTGSSFVIRLPAVDAERAARTTDEPPARVASFSLRILVVDDNHDTADSLAILLRHAGSETRTAYDGLEALQVANEFRPDVVLLDIGLPKADGHEVAQRLRREPWIGSTCLIAITGWSNDADRARSREAGFDHHLVKPLDPALLMELLASLEPAARR